MAQNLTPAVTVADAAARVSAELRELLGLLAGCSATSAETIVAVEAAGRLMDAARVHAVAPLGADPVLAERMGYPSAIAAVSCLAQVSQRSARERLRVAASISEDRSITGAVLPPLLPHLRTAVDAGQVGVDAAALVARELDALHTRVPGEVLAAAETVMVNLACGFDPSGEQHILPVSVDYLAGEVRQIGAAVDPDGARPREERARRRRSVRLGVEDADGLVPVSGRLQPNIAALLAGMLEAWRRSPRFVDPADADGAHDLGLGDSRTPDQRRHDAFAEIVMAAAAAKDAPQLDGRPVTVLVTVTRDDLTQPDGLDGDPIGTMSGSTLPVSRAQVERFIDAHGYRRVFTNNDGAVTGISSLERCFTTSQRLAIAARDGNRCSRPGCTADHTTLQVHHVIPWRDGGPTTTNNGILLCYWDHQRVDDGPWHYRMVDGLPEVRGPGIPEWTRQRPGVPRAA